MISPFLADFDPSHPPQRHTASQKVGPPFKYDVTNLLTPNKFQFENKHISNPFNCLTFQEENIYMRRRWKDEISITLIWFIVKKLKMTRVFHLYSLENK